MIADRFDTHADVVREHLRELDAPTFRLDLDVESLRSTVLHFERDEWRISQSDRSISSHEIKCVWPRRLTVSMTLEQQTNSETRSFRLWRSEWNRCLYGLYAYLRDAFWMNPIQQSSLADNKYFQFQIAKSVGFDIPEMISSNDKTKLSQFSNDDETALKFMTQDIFKMDDNSFCGIYVNKIVSSDLEKFEDIGENPVTLQRYIEKDFEVRHTYVERQHFSCKIESQKSGRANIDWRRYDIAHTPHQKIIPPKEIVEKIEVLMDRLGLTYGAFDFIVDKEGKWWYLEVNSAGQWLWIEDLLDMRISASIARTLSEKL